MWISHPVAMAFSWWFFLFIDPLLPPARPVSKSRAKYLVRARGMTSISLSTCWPPVNLFYLASSTPPLQLQKNSKNDRSFRVDLATSMLIVDILLHWSWSFSFISTPSRTTCTCTKKYFHFFCYFSGQRRGVALGIPTRGMIFANQCEQ